MILVGMTGGSGSGKSTVAEEMKRRNIPVIDCDQLYHSLISGASPCTAALIARFGQKIENESGGIDRAVLSHIVFEQSEEGRRALADLNAITHRHVTDALMQQLAALKAEGTRVAVLDAPTLIESGIHQRCDFVIAVHADKEDCLARIMARDGLSHEDAAMRIASQKPLSYYAEYADYIIENKGSERQLLLEVDRVLSSILREVKL